ncbi:MAG: hypothetical protein IJ458_04860 [Clostridia bacterium]|nr:hypothetical protein [Clostridia bacterium]
MEQQKEHIVIINEILLAKSLIDWRKSPQMSLRRIFRINCAKHFAPNQHINTETVLNLAIASSMSNLLRQTFVSNYEYLRHNIDDKMTDKLKQLRNSTSSNPNNINTTKFLDAIRQSFVHNDIDAEIPNWRLNDEFKVEVNFKSNSFTFDLIQLHKLMTEFLALKKEHIYLNFDVKDSDLFNVVNKGKLTPNNVQKYIILHNQDGSYASFDQYQCQALYNLLTPATNISPIQHLNMIADNNYFILQKLLPCKHNAGLISYMNNMVFRGLVWLNNHFIDRKDFIDSAYNFETKVELTDEGTPSDIRCSLLEFINYDSIALECTLISNALFTLFSISAPNKLQKYFSDIDVKRLRNSLMHGRYYYDNKNGFEFYDGRSNDNLEHIATLNINQILQSISSFVTDTLHADINPQLCK